MEARPIDIATRETSRFVAANAVQGSRILEIGCGDGYLARELGHRGYHVTAIDSSAESIEKARALGVAAELASWPEYESGSVDTVLFSRSLHHLHEFEAGLAAARRVLEPSGCLLVEDFAFRSVDQPTLDWFFDTLHSEEAEPLVGRVPGEFVTDLLEAADPLAAWHEDHDHDLHAFGTMREAIAAAFEVCKVEQVPYLYRYLIPVAPETPEAAAWIERVHDDESALGQDGSIFLVGRRIVATVQDSA